MRVIVLAALAVLAACSPTREPVMIEEAVPVAPEPSAGLTSDPACLPGDDGIGGTGCEVN